MTQDGKRDLRLRRLERRARWLTSAVLLLFGLVAFGRVDAWTPQEGDVVFARAFRLVDPDGNVLAELSQSADGPRLVLRDAGGVERVRLLHGAEESGLFVQDDRGDTRIGIAQFAHGGGGVALHGPEAKGAAVLYLKGEGSLSFYDAEGNVSYRVPAGN